MEKEPTYYEILITRYLSGDATSAEVSELSSWVDENTRNEKLFREYHKAWMAAETIRLNENTDVDGAWKRVRGEIRDHDIPHDLPHAFPHVLPHVFLHALRVAAVLVVLAIPSYFLFRYFQKPDLTELTASGGRVDTFLPDGSMVTLNSGATLRYPQKFKGGNRSVSLAGEAWFEVAHNISKPFVISAGNIRIEVKGTSFTVNTKGNNGDFELVLTTGKVELYFGDEPGVSRIINPGEKAVIRDHEIRVSPNEDLNYLAWKTHKITFSNDPLSSVAATLSKVYKANIRLGNPALASCRLTATFDNQSLESVLNVLKATLDIDIRSSGPLVEISGKGCK